MLVCILIPSAENFLLDVFFPNNPSRLLLLSFPTLLCLENSLKKKKMCKERGKVEGDHRTLKHSSSEAVWHICTVFTKMYAEGNFTLLFFGLNAGYIYLYIYIYIPPPPCVFQQSKVIKIWHLPCKEFGLIEVAAAPEVHKPPVKAAASNVCLVEERQYFLALTLLPPFQVTLLL